MTRVADSASSQSRYVRRNWLVVVAAVLAPLLLAATGCNQGPPMSTVKGIVKFTDGTTPQGAVALVQFQPSDASTAEIRKGATGPINSDGSFEMYTRRPGDGVHHGEYVVTFVVRKNVFDVQSLVDAKYTSPHTSPLKVQVDGDIDDLEFKLEPAGKD